MTGRWWSRSSERHAVPRGGVRAAAGHDDARLGQHPGGRDPLQALVVAVAGRVAVVVGRETRRAGEREVQAARVVAERTVELRRFRPEQRHGGHRGERRELRRAAVVGHQQRRAPEQRDQLAHRLGVARDVEAIRMRDRLRERAGERLVRRQADDRHDVPVVDEPGRKGAPVRHRPRADRQDPAARIDERKPPSGKLRKVAVQARAERRLLAGQERGRRRRDAAFVLALLVERMRPGLERARERQELQRQVPIGVVEHRPVDERAAVKALLRVAVEAGAQRRPGSPRQQAADPREELAIEHRIRAQATQRAQRREERPRQPAERAVVDDDDVLRRDARHQVEGLAVLAEQHHVQRRVRVARAQRREHRLREHQAAHLGEQDHHDPARRRRRRAPRQHAVEQRGERAQRHADVAIDRALEVEVHCVGPGGR